MNPLLALPIAPRCFPIELYSLLVTEKTIGFNFSMSGYVPLKLWKLGASILACFELKQHEWHAV